MSENITSSRPSARRRATGGREGRRKGWSEVQEERRGGGREGPTKGCGGRGDREVDEEEAEHEDAVRQTKSRKSPSEKILTQIRMVRPPPSSPFFPPSLPPSLPAPHLGPHIVGVNNTTQRLEPQGEGEGEGEAPDDGVEGLALVGGLDLGEEGRKEGREGGREGWNAMR